MEHVRALQADATTWQKKQPIKSACNCVKHARRLCAWLVWDQKGAAWRAPSQTDLVRRKAGLDLTPKGSTWSP